MSMMYISKFDIFRRRRRLYYVERSFHDKGDVVSVDDGEHFIYVNASNDVEAEAEDADVAELMEFFKNSQGRNEKFHRLTNRVYDLKNNESEVNAMCKLVEDYANEQKRIMICELVHECTLSAKAGAEKLGMPLDEFTELMKQFGYSIPEPA